jgi:hypothetical protein
VFGCFALMFNDYGKCLMFFWCSTFVCVKFLFLMFNIYSSSVNWPLFLVLNLQLLDFY